MPFYIVDSSSRARQVDVIKVASKFMSIIRNRNRTRTNKIICINPFRRQTSLVFFRCRCHILRVRNKSEFNCGNSFKLDLCVKKILHWTLKIK